MCVRGRGGVASERARRCHKKWRRYAASQRTDWRRRYQPAGSEHPRQWTPGAHGGAWQRQAAGNAYLWRGATGHRHTAAPYSRTPKTANVSHPWLLPKSKDMTRPYFADSSKWPPMRSYGPSWHSSTGSCGVWRRHAKHDTNFSQTRAKLPSPVAGAFRCGIARPPYTRGWRGGMADCGEAGRRQGSMAVARKRGPTLVDVGSTSYTS